MIDPKTIVYDLSRDFVGDYTELLGSSLTNKLLGAIRSRDLSTLTSCTTLHGPFALQDQEVFRVLYQLEACFKKNSLSLNVDVASAACRQRFFEAEEMCRLTNLRLEEYYCDQRVDGLPIPPDLTLYISRAQRYLERVLGPFESFLERLPSLIRVTSGATSTQPRRSSLPPLKFKKRIEITSAAIPYFKALSVYYGFRDEHWKTVVANRVEEVPKNWKTNRTIACEPTGVLPLQLAFDTYAKRRLRRYGIDLSDQSRNQDLARQGSVDGSYATIDLSMASDTVAFNTVALLFPQDWFQYLNAIRCRFASGAYGTFAYEKFSSMGNGSTFAIETLVFSALCYAVGSRDFSVYGDDIIIAPEYCEKLFSLLTFFGFTTNSDKTFHEGPFRESCGKHWFNGTDVTPFYIEKWSASRAVTSHNVNGLARVSRPGGLVWTRLLHIVKEESLQLAPFSLDSMAGVHIDVTTAYSEGLIVDRKKRQILKYRAYQPENRKLVIDDYRSLILWHLNKARQVEPSSKRITSGRIYKNLVLSAPVSHDETSRYTTTTHRYVRKWVHWIPPVDGTPIHLYWWSELVTRES